MCLLKKYILVLTVCIPSVVLGQRVPRTPCPDIFQYDQQPNGDVFGKITIHYDGSTTLILGVNASMKGYYSGRAALKIKMDTPGQDLIHQRANILKYSVYFPFQQSIPKITHIQLNERGFCDGPPEENAVSFGVVIPGAPGVTSMWSEHKFFFQTADRNDFPPPRPTYPDDNDNDDDDNAFIPKPIIPHERYPELIHSPSIPTPAPTRPSETTYRPATFSPPKKQEQGCGVTKHTIVPLILGGNDISDGMYPWMAAMLVSQGTEYEYKCTANLISEKHVITAARCVNYYKVQIVRAEQILLVFGKMNLKNWATNGAISRGAVKIQTHSEYNQVSGHGDVSIITLNQALPISNEISPICLWSGTSDFGEIVGQRGTVAGWGADEEGHNAGKFSVSIAKSIEMPIVSNEECLNSNLSFYSLTSDMTFCAGQRDGTGTCVGDNGAGFMIVQKGKYYLRGLASLTLSGNDGKCDLSYFMIFADVAKYTDWIETSMKE